MPESKINLAYRFLCKIDLLGLLGPKLEAMARLGFIRILAHYLSLY